MNQFLFSLEGLRAVVTGGAGYIGYNTALALARQGANVVLVDVRAEALDKAKAELSSQVGSQIDVMQCDLSDSESTKLLFGRIEGEFGNVDILVNNAGIDRDKLLMRMSEEDLDIVMRINFKAPFLLSQAAVMSMARRKFGRIINISSVVGFAGNPGQANYCSSKSALLGLSKSIALEYAKKGITVNCIAPGAIKTPMIDVLDDEAKEAFLRRIPLGHFGEPQDVAAAIAFLASREAAYITGQTIHVNGGMLMV